MNKDQLRIRLDELQVPPCSYNLDGKFKGDRLILDFPNHQWHVYVTNEIE
jgi:hypothetical protein